MQTNFLQLDKGDLFSRAPSMEMHQNHRNICKDYQNDLIQFGGPDYSVLQASNAPRDVVFWPLPLTFSPSLPKTKNNKTRKRVKFHYLQ